MMTLSRWRIFTDTKKRDSAKRLVMKLQAQAGRNFKQLSVDEYHKGRARRCGKSGAWWRGRAAKAHLASLSS